MKRLIILITNDRGFLIFKISRNRRDNKFISKYTGLVNEFNLLVDKLNFDKMPNMINFGIYIWPKSMFSVTRGKNCCIIKSMSSIVVFISSISKLRNEDIERVTKC